MSRRCSTTPHSRTSTGVALGSVQHPNLAMERLSSYPELMSMIFDCLSQPQLAVGACVSKIFFDRAIERLYRHVQRLDVLFEILSPLVGKTKDVSLLFTEMPTSTNLFLLLVLPNTITGGLEALHDLCREGPDDHPYIYRTVSVRFLIFGIYDRHIWTHRLSQSQLSKLAQQ